VLILVRIFYDQVIAVARGPIKLLATKNIKVGDWIEIDYFASSDSGGTSEQLLDYGFIDMQGPKSVVCRFSLKAIGKCFCLDYCT
jgi:hypothetical protein